MKLSQSRHSAPAQDGLLERSTNVVGESDESLSRISDVGSEYKDKSITFTESSKVQSPAGQYTCGQRLLKPFLNLVSKRLSERLSDQSS